MANNFPSSIDRISSFAYHGEPRICRSPIPEEIIDEPDIPLDAFDKELLAAWPPTLSEPAKYGPSSLDSRIRMSLPSRNTHAVSTTIEAVRTLRDGSYTPPLPSRLSSSSSTAAASSPTVVALQNRQSFHSPSSYAVEKPALGENMGHTDHFESVMAPRLDNRRQPNQRQGELPQQSHGMKAHRTHGPITRMVLGHAPPIVKSMPLIAATELPDRYRSIFPFPVFNVVQSKCFSRAFGSNDNLVVSAPTGSGKTAIMELAICHLLHTSKAGDFKIVYQAPTKSLCSERMRDWSGKFALLDLTCAELTGDTEKNQLRNVQSASIIITTPEKWDSVTRKWKDNARLMKMVTLFLIDEVHILKERRGATLEAVVSRMKSVGSDVRFVALSATVPNSDDIASWLGQAPNTQHLPAHREVFGEDCRPVKLEKHVWPIKGPPNDFAFDKILDASILEALRQHSKKKPTMIFCATRKMAVDTAKMLANIFASAPPSQQLWSAPKKNYRMIDSELSKIVCHGVAFHHGGVDTADRRAIEQGFLDTNISIICCTSTLAVGVNLPCYLVVIKGTVAWGDKGIQEYPDLEVMQMLGRAGRPQFETSACAVILTRPEKEQHYKKMVSGEEILESCLHLNLIEHLNSEIGLGTVSDMPSAKKWLASTFMFVRLQKNPRHYQLEGQIEQKGHDDLLASICAKDVDLLQEARLVSDAPHFKSTEFGDAMARYYIKFETMKTILAMAPKAKMSEIISTLAHASEFGDIRFKSGEKGLYKELNRDVGIKFPIKVDIAQNLHKVSLLIQSELGGSLFPNDEKWKKHKTQFNIDRNMVFSHVNRLIRCVIDCQLQLEDAVSVRHALELARSLAARVWDNSPYQMKQLDAIGEAFVRKLAQVGISSIETLQNTEPHRIERIVGRNPPFGQKVIAKALEFPNLRISVKETRKEIRHGQGVRIKFKADVGFVNEKPPVIFNKKSIYVCFLAETSDGKLIDFRRFAAKKLEHGQDILLSVQLVRPTTSIICHTMCDEIAGTGRRAELHLEHFPASYFSTNNSIAVKPKVRESSKGNVTASLATNNAPAVEDYGDLDDADLLAALDSHEDVEVIHDIDQFVLDNDQPAKRSLKRAASQISTGGHDSSKPFKVPVQLANGNWTCRHTCKEEGKSCKHKCCADGVEKPARPSQKKANKKDASVTGLSTDKPASKPAKSTLFEKARSQTDGKKQKLAVPKHLEAGITADGHQATATQAAQTNPAPSNSPAYQYMKGTAPKLSFMQNPYELSKNRTYDVEEVVNGEAERSKDSRLSECPEGDAAQLSDFDSDSDSDIAIDDVAIEKMTSLAEHREVSGKSCFGTRHAPTNACSETDGYHGVDSGQEDGIPANVRSRHGRNDQARPIASEGANAEVHPPTVRASQNKVHGLSSPGLGYEADFGAFIAPLTHVSPKATQRRAPIKSNRTIFQARPPKVQEKDLYITGESSSPYKTLPRASEEMDETDEYADVAVEAFFATLGATEYDVAAPSAKKQKMSQDPRDLMLSAGAVPELHTSIPDDSSFLEFSEMSRPPLGILQNGQHHQRIASNDGVCGASAHLSIAEKEKEEKAKDEEMKKWEGLEDFYEQFGDYVEIVE